MLLNTIANPHSKDLEFWADIKANHTSERVCKYISDLEEEMKDYMANRPVSAV
jgi:hypothetical protein